ncbi:hypothetical protein A359_08740 [secondary endosymbiont of Ctenarytaina eucalypti]|uniref:Uncharacterized protein n=1 Tax=secondary endosymbiont of Ctenarytaina eucalypti TaxID=1199245 RepID=J3TY33_9ENTR|nr:hypothetical protein A359_08740 [secondary endosymbiont of Ctenarytaina eucalypti]
MVNYPCLDISTSQLCRIRRVFTCFPFAQERNYRLSLIACSVTAILIPTGASCFLLSVLLLRNLKFIDWFWRICERNKWCYIQAS